MADLYWGAKDLKLGTVRAAVRQLGLAWPDFERICSGDQIVVWSAYRAFPAGEELIH